MIPLSRVKPNGKVDLWDTGPVRPIAPEPPKPIDSSLKGVERVEAEISFEDAVERYKQKVRAFTAAKAEHRDWHDSKGGPVKVELWGADARHALEVEPVRYTLDLPKGVKPGKAQVEAEEMAAAESQNLQRARASDPQFGQVGAPQ